MATRDFLPTQKYKEVKDEKTGKTKLKEVDLYKGTTNEEMIKFLKEAGTDEERREFKENLYKRYLTEDSGKRTKDGKIIKQYVEKNGERVLVATDKYADGTQKANWLYAKEQFFKKFAPEYLPKKKELKDKLLVEEIANW